MRRRLAIVSCGVSMICQVSAIADHNRRDLSTFSKFREAIPTRAASYVMQDGKMVLTSDWVPLGGPVARDQSWVAAFDCAEHVNIDGVLGPPFDDGFTCSRHGGSRWFFGAEFTNPFVSADMQTDAGASGAACEALSLDWYVKVGANEPDIDDDGFPDTEFYIAIQTMESMDVVECSDDGTGVIDGIIYDFTGNRWDPGFFNYANIVLSGTGLAHTMPADGVGGYQVFLAINLDDCDFRPCFPVGIDPQTQLGVAAQVMLWGTGNNERPIPQDRPGIDVPGQFDDIDPIDGVHALDRECFSYLFSLCPDPLAPSVTFWMKGGGEPCPCPGDANHDGSRDLADLALLLSRFGQAGEGCEDVNRDGRVDLVDLGLLLGSFAVPCP